MNFPFDIFQQAFEGNWVAWASIIEGVILIGMAAFLIILWWKMPQLAKSLFINETIGGHNPTVAQCLENKRVRFHNPQMLRNGFAYDKRSGATYIPPKLWSESVKDLGDGEREMLDTVYTIEGSQSAFFVNYSIQAIIINPEITALMQHEETLNKLNPTAKVSRQLLIKILQKLDGEYIDLKAVHLSLPINLKHLREVMPQSMSESDFAEFENKIRQDERGNKQAMNLALISLIVGVITLIAVIAKFFV